MICDKGPMVVHLVVIPYAEADLGCGKVFDFACEFLAVLSAGRSIERVPVGPPLQQRRKACLC